MPGVPLPSLLSAPARAIDFKTSRVRWPEWAVAISALVLLLIMLALSWFTLAQQSGGTRATTPSVGGEQAIHPTIATINYTINGWRGLTHAHWLIVATIVVAFALLIAQATRRAPAVPATLSVFVTLLALASTIWLFVRVVVDPPGGRDMGGWLALICALVLTWSGWKSLRTEGIAPEDAPSDIPVVHLADLPPSAGA